ncbi:MAG: hypothetical protein VB876_05000, partial [Pirellulales bacterium]
KTVVFHPSLDCQSMAFELADPKKRVEPFRASIPYAPGGEAIHIQLQLSTADKDNLESLPQHKFDPNSSIAAQRGETSLLIGKNGFLRVRLIANWDEKDKGFELVRQRPDWKTPKMEKARPFDRQELNQRLAAADQRDRKLLELIAFVEKRLPANAKSAERKRWERAKAILKKNFRTDDPRAVKVSEEYKKMIQERDLYDELLSAAGDFDAEFGGRLEMRIYSLADTTEIELMRSAGWKD